MINNPIKYRPEECGDPIDLARVRQLSLRYTEKPSIFSSGDVWCKLSGSGGGNIGYYKMRWGTEFVSRYGTYDTEYVPKKGHPLETGNYLVKLNGIPIIRGLPVKPDKWWQITRIEYYDFNNRQYYFSQSYLKGIWKSLYHEVKDSDGTEIMHLGGIGPYKPVSFDFQMGSEVPPDETAHALLFMLIKRYFEQQNSDAIAI